jgi:PPM family protein phosphatase
MTSATAHELEFSGLSHIGLVREDNQDAIRLASDHRPAGRRLFAVADGMGGYSHGGVASTTALETFFETFYGDPDADVPRLLKRSVDTANLSVYQTAQRLGAVRMGTTLTAATLVGHRLHLAHVGDSRAYLIRDQHATVLTNDHTQVGELVRMKVITPDKIRTHAQRSILTKGLGLGLFVQPDITAQALRDDDRIVLCSDGLWSVVEDHEFAQLAHAARDAADLNQRLIDLAIDRQSDDNLSAVVIHLHHLGPAAPASNSRRVWNPPNPFHVSFQFVRAHPCGRPGGQAQGHAPTPDD